MEKAKSDSGILHSEADGLNKKIIIVGAGIAGLSCAVRLKILGFRNVTVLEARDRIGGRICTVNHNSKPLELGAQWVHGEVGNVIYELASKHDLIDAEAPDYMDAFTKFPNFEHQQREVYAHAFDVLQEHLETVDLHSELPFGSYLQNIFEKNILDIKESSIKPHMQAFYEWFSHLLCELNGCESLNLLSTNLFNLYTTLSGHQTVELKFGYAKILNLLLDAVPREWILKCKNVLSIKWSRTAESEEENESVHLGTKHCEQDPVKVICEDNSVFFADHVIITLPLGCLKAYSSSMFTPSLPESKMAAINSIGFGVVNKIYLEFEKPFWKPTDIFHVIFDQDELLSSFDKLQISQCWYRHINRFAYVPHQQNMLCAWVTGPGALFMEKLSVEEVTKDCLKVLKIALRTTDVPEPINVIRSNWGLDPFARGSYSYLSVDCEKQNVTNIDLAEPLYTTFHRHQHLALMFAGEATHPHYFGTVHAAYETGIREANRIFSYYHPSNVIPPPVGCHRKVNCIIVGGGTAGIACAHRLVSSGLKQVLVLEALNRIGGRIHTMPYGQFLIEIGAQWIHGEDGNPLYNFAKKHNLLDDDAHALSEGKGIFCMSNGSSVPESLVNEVTLKINSIKELMTNTSYQHNNEPLSIVDVFHHEFNQYMISCKDKPETEQIKWALFEWYLRFEVIDNGCDNLRDITTVGYAEWIDSPGQFYTNLKDGFHSFLDILHNELPPCTIHTSKPVKCIHWRDKIHHSNISNSIEAGPVVVECANGDFYAANTVVVTSSIGFLKSNMNTFFNPNLPFEKRNAVEKVGFGTINKIYLEFQKPFWESDILGFQLVWLDHCKALEHFNKVETQWVTGISGFDRVRKQPNMLVAWIGGLQAKQLEEVSDEVVASTCTQLLRIFLNRQDIPLPVKVTRSLWCSNPYIKGAYSYRPSEYYKAGCSISSLKEPLKTCCILSEGTDIEIPAVLFAGEAVNACHFATVHGALSSGWDVAEDVTKFFNEWLKFN